MSRNIENDASLLKYVYSTDHSPVLNDTIFKTFEFFYDSGSRRLYKVIETWNMKSLQGHYITDKMVQTYYFEKGKIIKGQIDYLYKDGFIATTALYFFRKKVVQIGPELPKETIPPRTAYVSWFKKLLK